MQTFRSFLKILNLKTFIILLLSIGSTWVCAKLNFRAEFPLTIVGIAVVFPLVFSIAEAYKRREKALGYYASLKAHSRAVFFASRDWLETADHNLGDEFKSLIGDLMIRTRELLSAPIDDADKNELGVYEKLSALSAFVKKLRASGLPNNEASRANQFISKILIDFENLKHIYQYRTPMTLRAYSKVFIILIPILYGPYFAELASEHGLQTIILLPILFSVILVGLDNIQDGLESPFDQIGEDDILINAEKFVEKLDA